MRSRVPKCPRVSLVIKGFIHQTGFSASGASRFEFRVEFRVSKRIGRGGEREATFFVCSAHSEALAHERHRR